MTRLSRFLFISMCAAFAVCCLGLLVGLAHGIYATAHQHRTLEDILGAAIPFYATLGALGIVGFLFFLAFLISAASSRKQDRPSR